MSGRTILPQGPVSPGDIVYLAALYNDDYYILTKTGTVSVALSKILVSPSVNGTVDQSALQAALPLIATASAGGYTFQSESLYLSCAAMSTLLVLSSTPYTFYLNQAAYTPVGGIITAGIPYNLVNQMLAPASVTLGSGVVSVPVAILPFTYYSDKTADLSNAVRFNYCTTTSASPTWCSEFGAQAWTTQEEQMEGVTYHYCPAGVTCSGQCKSECSGLDCAQCSWTGVEFACHSQQQAAAQSTQATATAPNILSQGWFLALLAILLIIVIGIIVFALYKRPGVSAYLYETHHTVY